MSNLSNTVFGWATEALLGCFARLSQMLFHSPSCPYAFRHWWRRGEEEPCSVGGIQLMVSLPIHQPPLGILGLLNTQYTLVNYSLWFSFESWFPLLRKVLTKQEVFLGSRNGTLPPDTSFYQLLQICFPIFLSEGGANRLDKTRKCWLVH